MPTSRTGTKGASSGFTLVEVLVVCVALVVLAAMIVPTLHGAGRQGDLDGAAARVTASARFARQTAASGGVTVVLMAETGPDAIQLTVEEDGTASAPPASPSNARSAAQRGATESNSLLLPERFARVRLPEGVTAHLEIAPDETTGQPGAAADALRFPPDGHTEGGAIVLTDLRGRERRVLVAPGTGRVGTKRVQGRGFRVQGSRSMVECHWLRSRRRVARSNGSRSGGRSILNPVPCTLHPVPSTRRARSGFTLIEVLVATAVLAIGITAGVRALGAMARASAGAADRATAVRLAGERLALLEAAGDATEGALEVEVADAEGEYAAAPRFRWQQRVAAASETGLLEATMTVTWTDGLMERRYEVTTYLPDRATETEDGATTGAGNG